MKRFSSPVQHQFIVSGYLMSVTEGAGHRLPTAEQVLDREFRSTGGHHDGFQFAC
jgi:hypothetical protein